MPRRGPSSRDCARSLWLLGLTPPVTPEELTTAYRERVRRTHPDLHTASEARSEAATVLTRALNDARAVVAGWITSGRDWPDPHMRTPGGQRPSPEPATEAEPEATVCRHTGLRAGDRVMVWPYDGEPATVRGTELEAGEGVVWVLLADQPAARAEHVRLAAFGCPVCGACRGPFDGHLQTRPCADCLADLDRLERRPSDAPRIRSAIEARAEAGRVAAGALGEDWLVERAVNRRRWARRLKQAEPHDLRAALLGAFSSAFERWAA